MHQRHFRLHVAKVQLILGLGILLCGLLIPHQARSQALSELTTSEQPVPREYESWSLFLVCNPQWVLPEKQTALESLYRRFQAFGRALGPDHVAVWFWSRQWSWGDTEELQAAVDVVRSSAFCQHLGLSLSESPYLVVTTDYPGAAKVSDSDSFNDLGNRVVFALDDLDMAETTELIQHLADQISAEQFDELEPDSEGWYRKWQQAAETAQTGLLRIYDQIQITIDTQFFSVRIPRGQ